MPAVDRMSEQDRQVIRECLLAAVNGPFFPDWEFHTLMGFERAEIAQITEAWPHAANPHDQEVAVNNVLNNLLRYPHGYRDQWSQYSSATPQEIAGILARWRGDDELDPSARGTFDRLR